MQEVTIVTKIDNSQAVNAQESLRKEIKNLKLELEGLDKTSNEYKKTLDLIAQKSNLYQEKMNSVKTTSSQFSDIAKNNTNILEGLGKGFRDAASGIEIYAKAEGNAKNNLDKISTASSLTNRVMNVKGSVDNSQEESLKKQAIAAEDANKALIANSNTQAGLATATSATNNAVAIQGNGLIANNTIVDENTIAEEGLNNQLIIGTGSFKEHLNEIKNDSAALAALVEIKKKLLQWDNIILENNNIQINDLQELIKGNKLLTQTLVEMKKSTSSDGVGGFTINTEDFDKAINKVSKGIPTTAAFIKGQLNNSIDPTFGISLEAINDEITKLGESTKNAGKGISTFAQQNKELSKSISETKNEIKSATNAQDANNQNILKNAGNAKTALIDDKKVKVDSATASGELEKRNTMLAFSMAQIVREAPVASMSMDMFFLAISNNLPMLNDQIKAMKKYNKALVENGKAGEQVNIWKAVGKSLLSFNSLMMIGVTLLTMYGAEIFKWGKSLFYNVEALEKHKKAVEEQIAQNKELATSIGDTASKNVASFNSMKKEWDSLGGSITKQRSFIKEYKDELKVLFGEGKITLKQYSDYFGKFSDEVVNGYMLQAKAAAYMAAYQKIVAKEVTLELQDISWEVASFWETLQERFKTGFSGNWGETKKQKSEENRKEAIKQRAEDLQKTKADAKRLLEQAGKNSDAAEKQFKELHIKNQKETKADGDTTIKYTTKTYEDLNKTFLEFKDKNSSIRRD